MDKMQQLVCSAFIEKKALGDRKIFLSFLPSKKREEFLAIQTPSINLCQKFDLTAYLLKWVHYTWLAPFLRSLGEKEIRLFLSAFDSEKGAKLKQLLLVSPPLIPLLPLTKTFLQKRLADSLLIDTPDLLPPTALPSSPLNSLLELNTKNLRLLIEFLGLHDLAVEMKQIIDTIKLKKIQASLSKEKNFFLHLLTQKKEAVVFKKMELTHWSGQEEILIGLIHKRGMNRLAKALYPENSSLIWYVSHKISCEEALLLASLQKKLEHPKAYSLLAGQIIEIIDFFKTHNIQVDA